MMFELAVIVIVLAVCIAFLSICSYVIADRVEKLDKELEEMRKNGKR